MPLNPKNLGHWVVAAVFGALVFLTVVYRPSWSDEGQYLDPGANLALGRGFVSTCWESCAPGAEWGSSTPGFPLFFGAMFKVFGFGLWVPRVSFFLGHLLGAVLIIRWADRTFGMSPASKLVCFIVFMGTPALSHHAIYNARLECFALLICATYLNLKDSWEAGGAFVAAGLFLLGFVAATMGLHFGLYLALVTATLFLLRPSWSWFRFGLTLAAGMLAAGLALRLAYGHFGVWDQFLAHRLAHFGRELPWVPTGIRRFYVTKDLAIFAIGCAAVLGWDLLTRLDDGWRERTRVLGIIMALYFAIPLLVGAIGIWHAGYAWMLALPMVLGVAALFRRPPAWPLRGLAVLGLALGLAGAAREIRKIPGGLADDAIRKQAVADLEQRLRPGETVASTFDFFFELRPAEPMVFFRCEHESRLSLGFKRELYFPAWAQSTTQWLLACEAEAPACLEGIGGAWEEVRRYRREHAKGDYVLFRRQPAPGK